MRRPSPVSCLEPRSLQRSAWAPMYCLTSSLLAAKPPVVRIVARARSSIGLAVAFADQADDSVIFNDQTDAFDAVEITAAETHEIAA